MEKQSIKADVFSGCGGGSTGMEEPKRILFTLLQWASEVIRRGRTELVWKIDDSLG